MAIWDPEPLKNYKEISTRVIVILFGFLFHLECRGFSNSRAAVRIKKVILMTLREKGSIVRTSHIAHPLRVQLKSLEFRDARAS